MSSKEKVKEESVIKLSGEWDKLNIRLAELSFDGEDFNALLTTTTKIILSGPWISGSRISESVKSNLTASVQRFCGLIKNRAASTIKNGPRREIYARIATNLLALFKDPWPKYIKDRFNFNNLNLDDALDIWRKEGHLILKTRIEAMVRGSMFYEAICLSKLGYLIGDTMYVNLNDQSQLLLEEFNSEHALEPFFLGKDVFLRYHDIYFILILFEENLDKYEIDKWITYDIVRNTIFRLQEPCLGLEDNDKICPNWVGWTLKDKIASGLVTILNRKIWKVLKGQASIPREALKILFKYTFLLLSSNSSETPSPNCKLIENIFANANEIVEIEHIYALAETTFENYERDNPLERPNKLFLNVHIRALTQEVNRLEAAKIINTHNYNEERGKAEEEKRYQIQELQNHLSEKYELLGDYLTSFPYTSFQLCLTSFSLNPTRAMFDKLFAPKHRHFYSNTDTLHEFDQLHLNQTQLEDFSGIIRSVCRVSSLSWTKDIEDLEEKCKVHLETLGKNIIGRKRDELKHLELDYSKYQDKEYNVDDDDGGGGYERGYSPNNPRFKKKVAISQEISQQMKNMHPLLMVKKNPKLLKHPRFMNIFKKYWLKNMLKRNVNNNNHNGDNDHPNLPQRNLNFLKRVNFYAKYSKILKTTLRKSKFKSIKKKLYYTRFEYLSNLKRVLRLKGKLDYSIRLSNNSEYEYYGVLSTPPVEQNGFKPFSTSFLITSPIFSNTDKLGPAPGEAEANKKRNKFLEALINCIIDSTIFNQVPLLPAMPTISSMPSYSSPSLSLPLPPSKENEIVISNAIPDLMNGTPQNSIKIEPTTIDSLSPENSTSVSVSLSKESSQSLSQDEHEEQEDQIEGKSNIADKLNGEVIEP